jgi:signal transduction histidine kinase
VRPQKLAIDPARWSLRAQALAVVTAATLAPLVILGVSHWIEDIERDRIDAELAIAAREIARDPSAIERIAEAHGVRARIVDLERREVIAGVDHGSRGPDGLLAWLFYPDDVATLADIDRGLGPLPERRDVREASDRPRIGCRSDAEGTLLVCEALVREGDHVISVDRGMVRSAVRALYERKRDLAKLAIVLLPIGLGLGLWLSRRMVRPLSTLREEALARARAADPSAPLSVSKDEIGDVTLAINTLLEALGAQRRATEAFVADLAHEAKNPVASIRAAAEALEHDLTPERKDRLRNNLLRSSARLEALVSDLLELARLEARTPHEDHGTVDLVPIARSLVEHTKTESVEIVLDTPDGAIVQGSAARLEVAMRNLLENAASFAESKVEITITVREQITVRVEDDGPGIDAEALPKVFDRFFTTRGKRHGTGLGLAIVRATAEAHGGRATATSDGGAIFEITLPRG